MFTIAAADAAGGQKGRGCVSGAPWGETGTVALERCARKVQGLQKTLHVRVGCAGQTDFSCYNPRAFGGAPTPPSVLHIRCEARKAQVAQLVEQRTENPRVGGSIPPLGTISPSGAFC